MIDSECVSVVKRSPFRLRELLWVVAGVGGLSASGTRLRHRNIFDFATSHLCEFVIISDAARPSPIYKRVII
jgi:hypothetical protein